MLAQLIEHHTRLEVQRRFGLSTTIAHNALTTGQIDLYAEYTGTAYINVLKREEIIGPFSTYAAVDRYYRQQLDCDWLEPLGFNNTYAITVRREQAEKHGWQTISDLEPMADDLSGGFPSEFMERPDGYRGLCRAYGFSLGQTRDLSSDLMVEALARGQVDVISAFATDGRISEYDLKVLDDDRHYFPPYQAAPVVRQATLNAHPRLKGVLNLLAGRINDATMQRLNFQVQGEQRSVKDVAGEFLRSEGLLPIDD
jgi:glycine betaine/choline ABC-type transport system substrate-binding protein